jgi:hypothetical protein
MCYNASQQYPQCDMPKLFKGLVLRPVPDQWPSPVRESGTATGARSSYFGPIDLYPHVAELRGSIGPISQEHSTASTA